MLLEPLMWLVVCGGWVPLILLAVPASGTTSSRLASRRGGEREQRAGVLCRLIEARLRKSIATIVRVPLVFCFVSIIICTNERVDYRGFALTFISDVLRNTPLPKKSCNLKAYHMTHSKRLLKLQFNFD